MTTRANIYVDQGIDFGARLELFSGDSTTEYDITTEQFYCDVRKIYDNAVIFSADLTVVTDGLDNALDIFIPAERTLNVVPGKYQYDVVMLRTSTNIREKILEGLLIIVPTITKVTDV